MKRLALTRHAVALGALLTMSFALRTDAALFNFDLDSYGSGNAGGDVLVTIEDATAGNVKVTVRNNTEGFVTDLFLNYEKGADLAGATVLGFMPDDGTVTPPTVRFNGLQGFAIDLAFQTGNNTPGRFGPGESVTFLLDATKNLAPENFNVTGKGPVGNEFFAAVHVNGGHAHGNCTEGTARLGDRDGANRSNSTGVSPCEVVGPAGGEPEIVGGASVPEPHTLALVALGALGLVRLRRDRRT
jgi:hypothetical protein